MYIQDENKRLVSFIENLIGCPVKLPIEFKREHSSFMLMEKIFTDGNCGNFALALKVVFPNGKLVTNSSIDHVLFKLNDKVYDIYGEYIDKEFIDTLSEVTEDYVYQNAFGKFDKVIS